MNSGDYDVWEGRFLLPAEQEIVQGSPLTLVLNWPALSQKAASP